ncbi:hypothetical protein EsH8_XIV_000009 [Colletotrichum jinshuiense]
MKFEEISEQKGAKLYETPMLKPKSWRTMYLTMTSSTYWRTFVERLTKIMCQKGIDLLKHGKDMSKVAAIETLMMANGHCYAMSMTDERVGPVMCRISDAIARGEMGTSLANIVSLDGHMEVLARSILVVAIMEVVDSVQLSDSEPAAAGFLIAFLATNVYSVISMYPVELMYALKVDWYTSATCSDIRWIKNENVTRDPHKYPDIAMSMCINLTLGSIAIGNMGMTLNEVPTNVSNATVVSGMYDSVADYSY